MRKELPIYLLLLLLGAACLYLWLSIPKTACVQLAKVYEAFELRKQLDGKYKNVSNARKLQTDSMEMQLKALSNIIMGMDEKSKERQEKINEFEYKKQEYLRKKKNFSEGDAATAKMYEEQVWSLCK